MTAREDFLSWLAATQGTRVDDPAEVMRQAQHVANGDGVSLPVPGVNGPGDDMDTARQAEAARRGYSGSQADDYMSLLKGDTPAEVAASAAKLDRLFR